MWPLMIIQAIGSYNLKFRMNCSVTTHWRLGAPAFLWRQMLLDLDGDMLVPRAILEVPLLKYLSLT